MDICDMRNRVLLEVSAGDKDDEKIHVQDYFKDHDFIRICTSSTKNYFNKKHRFYQIPHAKLCCMIDTSEIFTRLCATNITNDLAVDSIADEYKTNFDYDWPAANITNAFISAVQNEIIEKQQKGFPIARYDADKKQAYLEYADGTREYVNK